MNQILYKKVKLKNYKIKYIILFFLSVTLFVFSTLYLTWFYYSTYKKEKFANYFLNSFNIDNLYSLTSTEYKIIRTESNSSSTPIGIIEIPKLEIKYPFFPSVSDELLKIAPCRFYGPMPNMVGNMCIAGHNYDDNRFFSNLYKLDKNDSILIFDLNGNFVTYTVYDKYEILANDTSCTNQITYGKREITLVTCNNINKNRLVIKACE